MASTRPLSARSGAAGEPDPDADADSTSAPTAGPMRTGPTNTSLLKRTSASTAAAQPSPTAGSASPASTAGNTPWRSSSRWSRGSNRPPKNTSLASSSARSARAASALPSRSAATRRAMASRSTHAWISPATAPATRATALCVAHRRHRARRDREPEPAAPSLHRSREHDSALSR
ncbi:hypothetical protein BDA96_04G357300 [Sorghum bicolor]|uniref:Uncharacterized protein n=1 Tax=Sorghum bicolor TaxID=4558 RepID=A0A921UMZ1_SORBI|nr:hypothetical protein BDA96_04G357300 [Sorghum bicolor]